MLVMIDAHLLRLTMEKDDEVGVDTEEKCQAFRADWEGTCFGRARLPVRLNTITCILIIDKMASVSLPKSLEYVIADEDPQHGIPKGSGVQPTTDQDRRKELQKIKDYKGLVDSVNSQVGVYSKAIFFGLTST